MSGRYKGNLPCLNFRSHEEKSYLSASELLHKSLGHVSYDRIRQKLGIPLRNTVSCEACALSKITRASFKHKHKKASRPFEELHLDLIGPISPTSHHGNQYILSVVDSHSRFCSAIPIHSKSDVFKTLTTIIDFEAKRLGYYPSIIHSNRERLIPTRPSKMDSLNVTTGQYSSREDHYQLNSFTRLAIRCVFSSNLKIPAPNSIQKELKEDSLATTKSSCHTVFLLKMEVLSKPRVYSFCISCPKSPTHLMMTNTSR
ncbi:hypothetical protein VP01_1288g6 [Puccinia sorghi]|uniref:Integrase catalytic domain-containing protein n=1 Tax=Puccinia sorghi TaxID=27349 RepID=A0A0L6VNL2_9BASI|nr:hypothetical protein VP01_1288g6 [Puccinia sorghi]